MSSDETIKTSLILDAFLPPKHPSMNQSIRFHSVSWHSLVTLSIVLTIGSWIFTLWAGAGKICWDRGHGHWLCAARQCRAHASVRYIEPWPSSISVLSKWKLFSLSACKGVGNWILCHISVYKIGLQGRQLAKYHLGHAVLPGFVTYCITRPNIILNLDYKIIFLYDLFYIHILYQLYILNYLIM